VAVSFATAATALQPRDWGLEHCDSIEWNTFGRDGAERTAILFREGGRHDYRIRDWRWEGLSGFKVSRLERGDYLVSWGEGFVRTNELWKSRTLDDREMTERRWWPDEKRRKLWQK